MSLPQVIVVGGGLSGLSAAHTALEDGCRVLLLDKMAFMGGNSTKATSGLNGAGTRTQVKLGIKDSVAIFEEDTIRSGTGQKTGPLPPTYPLGRVLTHNSGEAVHWVQDKFNLKLDVVSRLGGHSQPRTHRSGGSSQFPGMEITYALMQKFEEIADKEPNRAKVLTKARATKLVQDSKGNVIGLEYEKDGKTFKEMGPVVIATGGFGAGALVPDGGLLKKVRPDLMHLATTNGLHCTGDGVSMALAAGASAVDLEFVQVHPTGLVHQDSPDEKVKFLAAEALRGVGGIILDKDGKRFCDEVGTRDYVSGMMFKNKGPFRLVLNKAASSSILWHCKHYTGRRVMKNFAHGNDLAKDMGIDVKVLAAEFKAYNGYAEKKNDPYGRKYFDALPYKVDDEFYAATITPVVHYCMGGVRINENAEALKEDKSTVVPGLYVCGEASGGVHLKNRLGGSALLECVVFGRVAGASVAKFARAHAPAGQAAAGGVAGGVTISIPQKDGSVITITVGGNGVGVAGAAPAAAAPSAGGDIAAHPDSAEAPTPASIASAKSEAKTYTMEEVAKHVTEKDCWVVVNGQVINATDFLDDHPGGKMAIMTFAGRDATEEFNMVHDKNVVEKYAADKVIGVIAPKSKL